MADTQKPIINSFNLSENFDFGTITNQQDAGVSEVDLNDAQINYNVVDYINTTYDGRGRAYLSGKLKKDPSDGFYYLCGDTTKNGNLTFTQSIDSISAGKTLTMHLSGETRSSSDNYVDHLSNSGMIRPGVRSNANGNANAGRAYPPGPSDSSVTFQGLKLDTSAEVTADSEIAGIQAGYATHGHNSYAYMPHLHPDYSLETENQFDFGSAGFVTPLTSGTGIYTTRLMDFNYINYGLDGNTYGDGGKATNNMNAIDGASSLIVYESDGVTIDTMATYFAQQKSQKNMNVMKGEHTAMTLAIKLGSDMQTGEYTPFCFVDRVHGASAIMKGVFDQTSFWKSIRNMLSESTGVEYNDTDYWRHYLQYFTLTTNHFQKHQRMVKDMVIYIGKPAGGNELGGTYEIVYFASGADIYHKLAEAPSNNNKDVYINSIATFQKLIRVPIDDGSGEFDASTWNPFFLHTIASHRHVDYYGNPRGYRSITAHNAGRTYYRSTGGQMVSALGPGILDFVPGALNRTDICVDTAASLAFVGMGYAKRMHEANYGGWGANDSGFYYTFLTVPLSLIHI